ncbi:MAG: ATP-binding protein [Solirubrobacteraceae bacterium]
MATLMVRSSSDDMVVAAERSTTPYTRGAGKRTAKLASRDQDLADFQVRLERLGAGRSERSMNFAGLRGVGKTVLLLEFDINAAEAKWVSTGVQEVGSSADFRNTMARIAPRLLRSMSLRQKMKDRARAAFSLVKSFSLAGPGGIKIQLDVDAAAGTADCGDTEQDLADLLVEIGEVARAGNTGGLFALDEMQNLDAASLAAICMAYHRISQRELPVALVAAGLPTLPMMLRGAKPYASRLFSHSNLARLSPATSRSLLVGPAALQHVTFDEDALESIIDEAQLRGIEFLAGRGSDFALSRTAKVLLDRGLELLVVAGTSDILMLVPHPDGRYRSASGAPTKALLNGQPVGSSASLIFGLAVDRIQLQSVSLQDGSTVEVPVRRNVYAVDDPTWKPPTFSK